MSRAFVITTLTLCWVATTALEGHGFPVQPQPMKPRVPKNDAVYVPYAGTVTELTNNSITIQWAATPGELPKTFAVSEALAAGKIPMEPRLKPGQTRGYNVMPTSMYRLSDVKVGDWVTINYAHINGTDICDHIRIQKRPSGLVPPLPKEAERLLTPAGVFEAKYPGRLVPENLKDWPYIPYHEQMNAHWDLVDKGIPYPAKFGSQRLFPVAPMPRPARLAGPAISQ